MKSWPYCEGHAECHAANTRHYARSGTGSTSSGIAIILGATKEIAYGIRLCRAHALIRLGIA